VLLTAVPGSTSPPWAYDKRWTTGLPFCWRHSTGGGTSSNGADQMNGSAASEWCRLHRHPTTKLLMPNELYSAISVRRMRSPTDLNCPSISMLRDRQALAKTDVPRPAICGGGTGGATSSVVPTRLLVPGTLRLRADCHSAGRHNKPLSCASALPKLVRT
jgi:hypothetical protein